MKILPEPWWSMTEAQLKGMKEPEARQMLGSISTPELVELRNRVRAMQTSELFVYLAHPELLMKLLLKDEDLDTYDRDDEQLIMGAAALVIGDEVDRRVPRP